MNPDEILSSPPIVSFSTFKPGFSKYMQFTYNNKDDITGKTEYTITLDDNYKYIVDILVVGGGGASPSGGGGGGGAGGIVYIVNKTLDAGTYKIIVGNGGTDIINGTDGHTSMITFENDNTVILDGLLLKAYGGQSGSYAEKTGTNKIGGNGGISPFQKNTFWNGKSYESTDFKGASGGVNFAGGGGGSLSEGKDIIGGDGRTIDITGNKKLYGCGGGGSRFTFDNDNGSIRFIGGGHFGYPGSGGSSEMFSTDNSPGEPGIVIISYKTEEINYNKKIFCKVEDSNKNKYILTDKYKQPLNCIEDKCIIFDIKKAVDTKEPIESQDFYQSLFTDTKIQCKAIRDSKGYIYGSEPINKSNINFDNYNIASINKNISIINKDNEKLTEEQIEDNFMGIYQIDKNNENELVNYKKNYDYKQTILIEEDITKVNPKSELLIEEDITKINPKPSENNNNNNMYIGIGIGIFFFLLFCAFLYYNSGTNSTNKINDDIKLKKNK